MLAPSLPGPEMRRLSPSDTISWVTWLAFGVVVQVLSHTNPTVEGEIFRTCTRCQQS